MVAEVFDAMAKIEGSDALLLPPPSYTDSQAEIVEYVEGQSIAVEIPLFDKHNNPMGIVLGGYVPMFFDLAFGPLSYLVTESPTASLDINTAFIRPLKVSDEKVRIEASVVNISRSYLLLDGQALVDDGKLVATATSRLRIFR